MRECPSFHYELFGELVDWFLTCKEGFRTNFINFEYSSFWHAFRLNNFSPLKCSSGIFFGFGKSSPEFFADNFNVPRNTVCSFKCAAHNHTRRQNGSEFIISPTKLAHPFQYQLSRLRKRSISVCSSLLFVTFC